MLAATPGAPVPLRTPRHGRRPKLPAWQVLVALESHWRAYDAPPSHARLASFLRHSALATTRRLRSLGLIAPRELRLTARGVRALYSSVALDRRAA